MLIAAGEYVEAAGAIRGELKSVERFAAIEASADGWDDFVAMVRRQPPTPVDRTISEEDDLYQMYTSGTTGHPKGAVLQHRAVCANVEQVTMALRYEHGERALIVAPLYHAAAGIVSFSAVAQGASLYIQEDFDPVEVVRTLDEERIVSALLVPAMIQACLVFVLDAAERKYEDLQYVIYGASPIAEETLRTAMTTFKCDFVQGYGMTETTAVISMLSAEDHQRAAGGATGLFLSAGRPLIGMDLRIVDESDEPLPNGEVGEIIVRGPQLMRGYWNLPAESAEALMGGWMHTGDAGKLDDDGYLYIQDRVKNMIVSGGENVYPNIVENVLFQHPAIADVAVIGVPDEQWGETVKAIVVLSEGESATDEELMDFCRGKLGGFERPRSVDFAEALPRNASGKVLKKDLREPFWAGQERRVAGV